MGPLTTTDYVPLPLSKTHSHLIAEWHGALNDLSPDEITDKSFYKAWWRCSSDPAHVWQIAVRRRALSNSPCPYCKLAKTCLAAIHPELVELWHPTFNGDVLPTQVRPGGDRRFWWQCKQIEEHVFEKSVGSLLRSGCKLCAKNPVPYSSSLEAANPVLAKEWHFRQNRRRQPSSVRSDSEEVVWWQCPDFFGHIWQASVSDRMAGKAKCERCEDLRANSLGTNYPKLLALWHPTKNEDMSPYMVPITSAKSLWWICPADANHTWRASVRKVVSARSDAHRGCPFCSGRRRSEIRDIASHHPEVAAMWHPTKNDLHPASVSVGSGRSIWWICSAGHEFEAAAGSVVRARDTSTKGCRQCAPTSRKKDNESDRLRSVEHVYPAIAELWWHASKNLPLRPNEVSSRSKVRVWWQCGAAPAHEWEEPVRSFVKRMKSYRFSCPLCPEASATARAVLLEEPIFKRDARGRLIRRTKPKKQSEPKPASACLNPEKAREELIAFAESNGGLFSIKDAARAFVARGWLNSELRAVNRVYATVQKYPQSFVQETDRVWRCLG